MWSGFGPLGGPGSPRPVAPVLSTDQTEAKPVFSSGRSSMEATLHSLEDGSGSQNASDANDSDKESVRANGGSELIDLSEPIAEQHASPKDKATAVEADNDGETGTDEAPELNVQSTESQADTKVDAQETAQSRTDPLQSGAEATTHKELKETPSKAQAPEEQEPEAQSSDEQTSSQVPSTNQPAKEQHEEEESREQSLRPQGPEDQSEEATPEWEAFKKQTLGSREDTANASIASDTEDVGPEVQAPRREAHTGDVDHSLPHELERRTTTESMGEGSLRRSSIAAMRELGEPQTAGGDEQVPFDFQAFLDLIRTKQADPIVRYVKSFLQEFAKKAWTPDQQEKIVADFHKFITLKMKQFEPFKSLSDVKMRNAGEGMEKLVMNRLYVRTFPPVMPPVLRRDGHDEDLLKDQVLQEKLRLWGWVEGRHLDINVEYLQPQFLKLACAELSRIHQFRAPRDKMICVLNCCKVVWALIRQAHLEQNADSFLPLLIFVVLKAQPQHLVSNINYIQRFRAAEYRAGETMYYLSALASAVVFVEGLDKSSLTITDQEFEEEMTKAAAAERERLENLRAESENNANESRRTDSRTSSEEDDFGMESVLAASAGLLVDRMKTLTSHFFDDSPDIDTHAQPGTSSDTAGSSAAPEQRDRRVRSRESAEEQAVREASAEEYEAQQLREQEFNQILDTLEKMFPVLDKEVLEDVLREKNTNVGAAVDVCLALVGSS